MATQIVMDQTGDTRHDFNADDTEARFVGAGAPCWGSSTLLPHRVPPQPRRGLRRPAFDWEFAVRLDV
jgi:hypothetical protein